MASEYAAWFTAHKKDLSLNISEDAFSAFERFLESEIDVTTAASQLITGRTAADEDKSRRHVFSLIFAIAQFFPEVHAQLIELLKEIVSDTELDREPLGWELRAIHDGLETQIKEALNTSTTSTKQTVSETFTALQNRWANFQAFNAKCSAAGTVNIGEHFIIPAIEQSLEATSPRALELQVYSLAAAAWLAYASPTVLALSRSNASSNWVEVAAGDKLWKGKTGFSEGRWEFWKKRLEELREQRGQDLDYETVALMRQAFVAMEKAERAKKGKK